MSNTALSSLYRGYIECLNGQNWAELDRFVDDQVKHNGRSLGLSGYRDMLVRDHAAIPDLQFNIDLLVCETPHVAARLLFNCTPRGEFLGLRVDGRKICFAENVFYEFRNVRIMSVWSVIDKAEIEMQLRH
ncbi:MAG: ester cyclase [Verrucomicrobia bacterium]|nr:ester cyclase [Verrucomicrobiota bacterium]